MSNRLGIVVTDDCTNCEVSRRLAAEMSRRYPSLQIDLINLSDPDTICPEDVFAVPTFLYNDRLIFLGNPSQQELDAFLQEAVYDVRDR